MSAENDVAESRWDTFALATNVPDPARRTSRASPTSSSITRRSVILATPSSWASRARRAAGHRGPALDQQLQLLADLLLLRRRRARLYGGHRRTTTPAGRLSR